MLDKLKEQIKLTKDLNQFEKKWISIMSHLGCINKLKQTFSLNNTTITPYGFKSSIYIVDGLNFEMLETKKSYIEDSYGCMLILNKNKRSNWISAEYVFKTPLDLKYKPIKVKAWELYLGNGYNKEPIVVDLIKYPHALITGGTRSGKSKMDDCILTTLIYSCNEFELELYLCQVAKSDLVMYEDAIQCRAFADTLDKVVVVLEHLQTKMSGRDKLIKPIRKQAKGDNYQDYNKLYPNNPFSTVHVVFDEMASLFDTKGDDTDTKKKKERIVKLTDNIAQYGASLGIFLNCSLQRPTADKLSPFIKSQSTCIVSFRQNNSKSSEVALDDSKLALGLEQREFIYFTGSYSYGLVPYVYSNEIIEFIRPKLKPNHRTLFDDLRKLGKNDGSTPTPKKEKGKEKIEKDKVKPTEPHILPKTNMTFERVDPGIIIEKQNKRIENIKKIPNFVPYDPKATIIIDGTKIPAKTEKPIKKGREKIEK